MNKNKIEDWTGEIHQGDAVETLSEIPESSIHMCMCSPPYYGLRDYGESEQIGLEETVDQYIKEIVKVGDELKRVLRGDGSWWLNIGDTYSGGGGMSGVPEEWESKTVNHSGEEQPDNPPAKNTEYRKKQKLMIPHRIAIALQKSGWIIRNEVTWHKPNAMPESVEDRLSNKTEKIYHLVPNPNYWYDLDSVKEPSNSKTNGSMKNPGDIFQINTKSYPSAHFAVYPEEICEKPIKSSCPSKVCAECKSPYVRNEGTLESMCDCKTENTESGIVIDPFVGSGTTCLVASRQGREWIGIDISEKYVEMSQERIREESPENANDPLKY